MSASSVVPPAPGIETSTSSCGAPSCAGTSAEGWVGSSWTAVVPPGVLLDGGVFWAQTGEVSAVETSSKLPSVSGVFMAKPRVI
jgi:hypothetical protein